MRCFDCFKFESMCKISYKRIELDFQKSPSSDLAVSRPKKLAQIAMKLVRSTCSRSRIELRTSIFTKSRLETNNGQQLYASSILPDGVDKILHYTFQSRTRNDINRSIKRQVA